MSKTYDPIASTTLASAQATVTFNSISGAFTDLLIIVDASASSTAFDAWIQFNGDTGSNYSFTSMNGTGSVAQSFRASSQTSMATDRQATFRAGNRTLQRINIMNYSNTTTNKTVIVRSDSPADATEALVGLWRSTSAITSLTIGNNAAANYAVGSIFTIYGIKAE